LIKSKKMIEQEIKRILVIQLRQMGDVLLTTPALRALRKKFPDAQIAFLVDKPFEPLLRHNPDLSMVLVRDPEEKFEPIKTIQSVREFKPGLVIDYLANPRTALLTALSGAKITLSYANKPRSLFYKLKVFPAGEYVAEEKLSLLKPLGIEAGDLALVFRYPASADENVALLLKENRIDNNFLVALDMFHKRPSRQWPISYFMEIADRLTEKFNARVVITCLPENRIRAEHAVSRARHKHIIFSQLDLFELAALIHRARLFIGGDAGPKHIAVSQNTPSFTILGPSGNQWTPRSALHETAYLELDCRPCGEHQCPKPEILCQTRLTPDMVWERLSEFIKRQI